MSTINHNQQGSTALAVSSSGQGVLNADKRRSWLDRIGISASLLCAVHCLAAPFLLLLLPAAGSVWAHPLVHWVLAVLVLPLALWVIYGGYRRHRKTWTLVAAGVGSACIVAGLILPMVSRTPLVTAQIPSFGFASSTLPAGDGSGGAAAGHAACSDACCPTVAQDASTGSYTLNMPPGGLVTMIGSIFLVFAHLTNLIACRKFGPHGSVAAGEASGCGCPEC